MSIVGVVVSLGVILLLMSIVVRSCSSSSGIVGVVIGEARLAIHIIWFWQSVLLSVALLISLKSDFLLDKIELLLLIWGHIVLDIVLRCTVFPLLSDRSLRSRWESLINLRKMTIIEVVIRISRRCRGDLATWSYHIIETIYLGWGWDLRVRIIRSIRKILMNLISDDLEAFFVPLIVQSECVCHNISHIKGIFGTIIRRSSGPCRKSLTDICLFKINIILRKVVASLLKSLT